MKGEIMKKNLVFVLLAVIVFNISSDPVKAAEVVIEVESLELSNAQIEDLESASGKVVAFDVESAEAKGEVELDRGLYVVYLYMYSPDGDHDAVYVAIGATRKRVYPAIHATITESEAFTINIPEKKKYPISITCGETGVLLDRLVIRSAPDQAVTKPTEEVFSSTNTITEPTDAAVPVVKTPMAIHGMRPRVIATTDGEVDDRSSMIRFLLYACDFDIAGIVQVNSRYQKSGRGRRHRRG